MLVNFLQGPFNVRDDSSIHTRERQMHHVAVLILLLLLGLCAVSCFFHFVDSFKGSDGKVYYGFVTPKGLAVLKPGLAAEVPKEERYKVGLTDFVHAIMSVMVFVAIAFSDHRGYSLLVP